MGLTNYPNGIASFGIPVLPGPPLTTGQVFFVDSVTGSNNNTGKDTQHPVATIDYAIGLCRSAKGDVIFVMPGHLETVIGAAGIAADVAGINIIGLGMGRNRPRINYTTAIGASVNFSAANILAQNLVFTMMGFDAITAGINVSAADVTLRGCEVEFANATNQAVLALLTTAAADRLTLEDNFFHGSNDAGTAAALRIVGGDAIRVRRNTIIGNFTTSLGGIDNVTTALTNGVFEDNNIYNRTASSTKVMVFVSTSTLMFQNNNLGILSGTAPVTAAAGTNGGGNYYSAAVGVAAATLL